MAAKAGTKKAAPAGAGDNSEAFTAEDREALFTHHLVQARKDATILEKAMEAVRGVKKARKKNREMCRMDGFALKYLDEILAEEQLSESDRVADAEMRTFMRVTANLPVIGARQLDLFSGLAPASAESGPKTEADYRSMGYNAGFSATGPCVVPEEVPPGDPAQWWVEGWNDAQRTLGERLSKAKKILKG